MAVLLLFPVQKVLRRRRKLAESFRVVKASSNTEYLKG